MNSVTRRDSFIDYGQDNNFVLLDLADKTNGTAALITEQTAQAQTERPNYKTRVLTLAGICAAFLVIAALAMLLPKYVS